MYESRYVLLFSSAVTKKPMVVTTKNGIYAPRRFQSSYLGVLVWRRRVRFYANVYESRYVLLFSSAKKNLRKTKQKGQGKAAASFIKTNRASASYESSDFL